MTIRGGGRKRSSWLIFRRRLALVRTLLRGPASRDALVAAVQQEMGAEGYLGDVASALKHDLDALKEEFGCRITFRRSNHCYVLADLGELALLDLPDACLEALIFLDTSFPAGTALPEHAALRELLDRIALTLPSRRRQQLREQRTSLSLRLAEGPGDRIDPAVLAMVRRACTVRQELSFAYRSNREDGAHTRHRVAPYEVFFRPDGHGYLDATLLEIWPREPGSLLPVALHYRLDRIVAGSVHILPTVLPPQRIAPVQVRLRYWLHPNVARRRDIAVHFPESEVVYHDDGSATVTAMTTNLWQARQTLLRYGSACRVLEPPELIALFRTTINELAARYAETT